jgi:hypothetical protein
MEFVRTKGPLIGPVSDQIAKRISNGLIHDWLGAGFVPNARIEDIVRVVRDYDSYKRIYRPGVIDSLSHGSEGDKDVFFMRLANRSVVSKTALDAECEAHDIRVDDHRWYAYSNTERCSQCSQSQFAAHPSTTSELAILRVPDLLGTLGSAGTDL